MIDKIVVAYHLLFFTMGAITYHRGQAEKPTVFDFGRRWWPQMLAMGLALLFPLASSATFHDPSQGGSFNPTLAGLLQVMCTWAMTLGLSGLFAAAMSRERAWVRSWGTVHPGRSAASWPTNPNPTPPTYDRR